MVYGDLVYGGAPVYGGGAFVPVPVPSKECDDCGDGWRVEATHMSTGVVKAVLRPLSADWEEQYSRPGTGSLMVATQDPSAEDVWAHETGIYISRVKKDGTRVGHFGGYVESFSASGGGATTIGLQSFDEYPFHRLLADDDEGLPYSTPGYVSPEDPGPGKSQTEIAYDLFNLAIAGFGAVPLLPIAHESTKLRVRSWAAFEFKNLGEAIQELVDTIDGVKYRLEHQFFENPARWQTVIQLFDDLRIDRGVKIRSGYEAYQSSLVVDAKDQASRVYGVGTGEGSSQMFSIAYDEEASLPEFQKTVAWKDVSVPETLDEYTRGAVTMYREPATTPTATLIGLTDVPPDSLRTGDIISADIGYGLATFRGEKAQVISQAWQMATDETVTRSLGLEPVIRPSLSVKTQVAAVAPPPETLTPEEEVSPPPETPITPPVQTGLVTTVKVDSLNEISGMQFSNGNVLLTNDEDNNPQVISVSLTTGQQVTAFNVPGPSRKDPEALRASPDGRVWLGDIGDNDSNRSSVKLYEVGGSVVYSISYPFGSANAEALLIHPVSGEFFVVTKTGRAVAFGTSPAGVGTQVATGLPSEISDGTFTNDGKFILFTVAGASVVYVHSYPNWQSVGQISIPNLSKCESITMDSNCSFLISTEGKNAPIYRVALPKTFGGCV